MALQKANKNGATAFKFQNAGDTIKGYYQGQVSKTINGMPAIEHTYKTSEGLVGVLGQANILNQFKNNGITPGTYVEITYSGQVQKLKGGKTMKVYDVSFDLDDRDGNPSAPSLEEETADAEEMDEPVLPRVTAPRTPASTPSSDARARTQALLGRRS